MRIQSTRASTNDSITVITNNKRRRAIANENDIEQYRSKKTSRIRTNSTQSNTTVTMSS
jgi:hypothetical protein